MRYLFLFQDSGAGVEDGLVQELGRWKTSLECFDAAIVSAIHNQMHGRLPVTYSSSASYASQNLETHSSPCAAI